MRGPAWPLNIVNPPGRRLQNLLLPVTGLGSMNTKFRRYLIGGLQPPGGFQGHLRLEPRLRRGNDALYCLRFILPPFHSLQAKQFTILTPCPVFGGKLRGASFPYSFWWFGDTLFIYSHSQISTEIQCSITVWGRLYFTILTCLNSHTCFRQWDLAGRFNQESAYVWQRN